MKPEEVQVKDKYCLTIDEAAAYFNIGSRKLRQLASEQVSSGIFIQHGAKILIKRKRFEAFLEETTSL